MTALAAAGEYDPPRVAMSPSCMGAPQCRRQSVGHRAPILSVLVGHVEHHLKVLDVRYGLGSG
jgi:hypothetical protein